MLLRERETLLTRKVSITKSYSHRSRTGVCSIFLHGQLLQVCVWGVPQECVWVVPTSGMPFLSLHCWGGRSGNPCPSPILPPCITISHLSQERAALFLPQFVNWELKKSQRQVLPWNMKKPLNCLCPKFVKWSVSRLCLSWLVEEDILNRAL